MSKTSINIKKTDLCLVGCGYWGKNLARNFHQLGVLRAVCENSRELSESISNKYKDIDLISDLETALEDPDIRKVAVAAPAAQHYEIAKSALLAGKDVFVEKPLCLEVRQAEELIEIAEKKAKIIMVGHLLHYHPCIVKIKELAKEGALGDLYHITSNRLNLGKIRHEENVLWSFAPHDISVILSIVKNAPIEHLQSIGITTYPIQFPTAA